MNILDPIRPANLTPAKFVGFFSGVAAALGGFYAFMVSTWWGYITTETVTESVKDKVKLKVVEVSTQLNHAMNLQGFLGALTPAAILAVILGAWGAATLKKVEQRFWAILAFGVGLSTLVVVLWVNVFTPGKVGEYYWRGMAFMTITLAAWCTQAAYYHVKRRRPRRTASAPPAIP